MAKFADHMEKISTSVVEGYQKIEDGVVEGFNKVTDKCVEKLFTKEGETVEEAKKFAQEHPAGSGRRYKKKHGLAS